MGGEGLGPAQEEAPTLCSPHSRSTLLGQGQLRGGRPYRGAGEPRLPVPPRHAGHACRSWGGRAVRPETAWLSGQAWDAGGPGGAGEASGALDREQHRTAECATAPRAAPPDLAPPPTGPLCARRGAAATGPRDTHAEALQVAAEPGPLHVDEGLREEPGHVAQGPGGPPSGAAPSTTPGHAPPAGSHPPPTPRSQMCGVRRWKARQETECPLQDRDPTPWRERSQGELTSLSWLKGGPGGPGGPCGPGGPRGPTPGSPWGQRMLVTLEGTAHGGGGAPEHAHPSPSPDTHSPSHPWGPRLLGFPGSPAGQCHPGRQRQGASQGASQGEGTSVPPPGVGLEAGAGDLGASEATHDPVAQRAPAWSRPRRPGHRAGLCPSRVRVRGCTRG